MRIRQIFANKKLYFYIRVYLSNPRHLRAIQFLNEKRCQHERDRCEQFN